MMLHLPLFFLARPMQHLESISAKFIASLFALRSNAIQCGEALLKKQALWYRDRKFATALKHIFFRMPREATS